MASPFLNPGFNVGFTPVPLTTFKYGGPVEGIGASPYAGLDRETIMLAEIFKKQPFDFEGAGQFMDRQAAAAERIAKGKLRDEANLGFLLTGTKAAADGLQTALAGGSPEMLAYNAQAPLRAGQAYLRASLNPERPRQNIAQQAPPTYIPQRFFG